MKLGLVEAEMLDADETRQEILTRRFKTLISSIEGSFPMNRDVGINQEMLDAPVSSAITLLSVEIYQKAEKYIPEIDLEDIECSYNLETDTVSVRLICRESDMSEEDSFHEHEAEEDEDYERD